MIFNHQVYKNSSVSFQLHWHPVAPLWRRSQDPGGTLQQRSCCSSSSLQRHPGHAGLFKTALQASQPWPLPPTHPTTVHQVFEKIGLDPWRPFSLFGKAKQKQNFEELRRWHLSLRLPFFVLFCFNSISVDSELKGTLISLTGSEALMGAFELLRQSNWCVLLGWRSFSRSRLWVRKWKLREFAGLAGRESLAQGTAEPSFLAVCRSGGLPWSCSYSLPCECSSRGCIFTADPSHLQA